MSLGRAKTAPTRNAAAPVPFLGHRPVRGRRKASLGRLASGACRALRLRALGRAGATPRSHTRDRPAPRQGRWSRPSGRARSPPTHANRNPGGMVVPRQAGLPPPPSALGACRPLRQRDTRSRTRALPARRAHRVSLHSLRACEAPLPAAAPCWAAASAEAPKPRRAVRRSERAQPRRQ